MASGDVVGMVLNVSGPQVGTDRAEPAVASGGSSENYPVLRYDDTLAEEFDLLCNLDGYGGGGITVELVWGTVGVPNATVAWEASIRRLDAGHSYTGGYAYGFQAATPTQAPAQQQLVYTTISFTDGAQMDGTQNGERFLMRVSRTTDAQTGDVELFWPMIIIRET